MATKTWRGDAPSVAQVDTIEITAYDAATTYKVTINGKVVSAVGVTSLAATASALQAALTASTIPEFAEVTWAYTSGATLTGTANEAGKPFTATVSVTGGTGTISTSTTTSNSSPNSWGTAANWTPSGVPVSTDTVHLFNSSVGIYYDLDQNAVTLTALKIDASYTGYIGLPEYTGSYWEYRETYLKISATDIIIGEGSGNSSGRLKINTGSVQTAIDVKKTGTPIEPGRQAILWKGTHASNEVEIASGSFGAATLPGETATIETLTQGYVSNKEWDSTVYLGTGCTLTTIDKTGGKLTVASAFDTLTQEAGTVEHVSGDAEIVTVNGGTYYWMAEGSIASIEVLGGARLDCTRDPTGRNLTEATFYRGCTVQDPAGSITFANPFEIPDGTLPDITINLGAGRAYQVSDVL